MLFEKNGTWISNLNNEKFENLDIVILPSKDMALLLLNFVVKDPFMINEPTIEQIIKEKK